MKWGHFTQFRRWVGELKALPRGKRSVQGAITRWIELAKWPTTTEWDPCGLADGTWEWFESKATVEAIATGALIASIRRVDPKCLD